MFLIRPPELESGRSSRFVQLGGVAAKVKRYRKKCQAIFFNITSFTGVLTSPDYPSNYPNSLDMTESLQVESGKVLRMEFTFFAVEHVQSRCSHDYVKVTDGDGTVLMDNSCGYSNRSSTSSDYFLPPNITTRTNTVNIIFHTNSYTSNVGWSLNWTALAPGLSPSLNICLSLCLCLSTGRRNDVILPFHFPNLSLCLTSYHFYF